MNCFICYATVELKRDGTYKCQNCENTEFVGATNEQRSLFNKDNKFDIDLAYGEIQEKELYRILAKERIEVKAEKGKWKKTGNIAVELSCRGKLSGLSTTKAGYWATVLAEESSRDIKAIIIIPTDEMKKRVKSIVKQGSGKMVMGGDENASELALIPLKELFDRNIKEKKDE